MNKLKIFIAGHKSIVGSALVRALKAHDVELITKDGKNLDLLNQNEVQKNYLKMKN